jgi:hypothetical protein
MIAYLNSGWCTKRKQGSFKKGRVGLEIKANIGSNAKAFIKIKMYK